MPCSRFLSIAVVLSGLLLFRGHSAANVITDENAQPGTTAWQLTNPATGREIEGFASATSVNKGNAISFFVSTGDASFNLEIYRMGWYGGTGSRQVFGPQKFTGKRQVAPVVDAATGLTECKWT